MELDQMPQPGPGLCGSDREVFERVWRRVMPEDRPDNIIELNGAAVKAVAPIPRTVPAPVAPAEAPRRGEPEAVSCLGPASAVHGAELQAFIEGELSDFRTYQALARRCTGQAARTLGTIASDERRHAKRLSAAYFLISGVRYWPLERAAVKVDGAYWSTLRNRFLAEQKGQAAYRAAAEGTEDPCLRELYLELAEEEESHGWLVRGILEAM